MRILVTGANGQVGWELRRRGVQAGLDVLAMDRTQLDITDSRAVVKQVARSGATLVVNAAAYTDVDRAESEPQLAYAVNRDGPAHLASACAEAGVPLIHISTDYVFDGRKKDPNLETDPVSPLSIYGDSKAAGEAEVRARLREHLIIRTAWVYGIHGHNFVKSMLRLGRERRTLRVVADQYGCPTYAADLAGTILLIASSRLARRRVVWGTYHYCGEGLTTWHGFAQEIFALAGRYTALTVQHVEPISTAEYPTSATRPAHSALDCSMLKKNFNIALHPWPQALSRMITEIFSVKKENY